MENINSYEDCENSLYIFAKTLANVFNNGSGMIIELSDGIVCPNHPEAKKVLVYHLEGVVYIQPTDDKRFEDGDYINVFDDQNLN